ncbi:MAG: hypothetical protein Q8N96_12760 [Methylovulum sp.]|nr:hypothetical protein [Methylovulum sp.]
MAPIYDRSKLAVAWLNNVGIGVLNKESAYHEAGLLMGLQVALCCGLGITD